MAVAYAFVNVTADAQVVTIDSWADFDRPFNDATIGVTPLDSTNDPAGTVHGAIGQFLKLRKQGKAFDFILSLGGWSLSKYFSTALSTDALRHTLATNVVAWYDKYPGLITGIDFDVEYLTGKGTNYGLDGNIVAAGDDTRFCQFLDILRPMLPSDVKISMCCSPVPEKIDWDVNAVVSRLDELRVMLYDLRSGSFPGDEICSHQSNLYPSSYAPLSGDGIVQFLLSKGVPPKKIFIGVAMYSRGYANAEGLGLYGKGASPDDGWEPGIVDYKALPVSGATEYWDDVCKAPYSYDSVRKVFNTYDDYRSAAEKAKYVCKKGLGGIIAWSIDGDHPVNHQRSITKAILDVYNNPPLEESTDTHTSVKDVVKKSSSYTMLIIGIIITLLAVLAGVMWYKRR